MPLSRFDGKPYGGCAGDTLASALLANDVRLVGRSFKYHRPRGMLSAGPEEPNALVELRSGARREPNTRATVTELYDGLEATSQNRWPSLTLRPAWRSTACSRRSSSPGFYYKTFMWPASFWEKVYEPLIRRAAGLGPASLEADPDPYEKSWAHCDVLVIGAGPAGLAAALTAARTGARVMLADEDFALGGRLLAERRTIDGQPGADWAAQAIAELRSLPEVRLLPRTTVFGVYDGGIYGAVERVNDHLPVAARFEPRQRLWRIVARNACWPPAPSSGRWSSATTTGPASCWRARCARYVNRYGVLPGQRAVVFTDNDDGWTTATDLAAAGAHGRSRRRFPRARRRRPSWRAGTRRRPPSPAKCNGRAAARRCRRSRSGTRWRTDAASTATSSRCRAAGRRRCT